MPLAGGEGEYRTVGTTAFEKIRMALENEAYLINYMSGWEGVQSQMTLQLKIDSGGCGVQIKESRWEGAYSKGLIETGKLENIKCRMFNGRPLF